uniref:(northern house mosquito) hypothetical protein n=1 Tax=Culex pipiens TaxID=7175 RepID=A0A8D8G0J3_CULPI
MQTLSTETPPRRGIPLSGEMRNEAFFLFCLQSSAKKVTEKFLQPEQLGGKGPSVTDTKQTARIKPKASESSRRSYVHGKLNLCGLSLVEVLTKRDILRIFGTFAWCPLRRF